jgi:hypothetical protein
MAETLIGTIDENNLMIDHDNISAYFKLIEGIEFDCPACALAHLARFLASASELGHRGWKPTGQ